MKRTILYAAILVLAAMALSGCGFVFNLVLNPDFEVVSVNVLTGASDEITGLRITFGNWGGGAENIPYVIVFSYDTTVSPTAGDFVIYEGEIPSLEWNDEIPVDVSGQAIQDYIDASSGGFVPEGQFYIGVFIDPNNDFEERDEFNNENTTGQSFLFGGGGEIPADQYEPDGPYAELEVIFPVSPPYYVAYYRNFHTVDDNDFFLVYCYVGETLDINVNSYVENDIDVFLYDGAYNPLANAITADPWYEHLTFPITIEGYYAVQLDSYDDRVGDYDISFEVY